MKVCRLQKWSIKLIDFKTAYTCKSSKFCKQKTHLNRLLDTTKLIAIKQWNNATNNLKGNLILGESW